MQRRHSQFGRRKNAASPRRLALRLVMHDLSKDFFRRLAVGSDSSPSHAQEPCKLEAQEPLSAESPNATKERAVLDVADLRSLHQMFLLLDEWDRAMAINPSSTQKSSEKCEIAVDRKTD
jgi:hypothetical protein